MSYRRNKSHKVPNVKLRPAIPASSASSSTSRNGAKQVKRKDSGFDSEGDLDTSTTYSVDVCPRPFKGVVLCATGINDKACHAPLISGFSDVRFRWSDHTVQTSNRTRCPKPQRFDGQGYPCHCRMFGKRKIKGAFNFLDKYTTVNRLIQPLCSAP